MINYVYQLIAPRAFSIKYTDISMDGNVIIKPRYMSICHADQRYYTGNREQSILDKKLPMALIHECCGEVVFDPSNKFKVKDKVVLIPNIPGKKDNIILENYAKDALFSSSNQDGFMREFIEFPAERILKFDDIPEQIAAITEFVSIAIHATKRFLEKSHERKTIIGIWGDGSLAFVLANVLKEKFPRSKVVVVGKNKRKLAYFSFVNETYLIEELPENFSIDHAFECCGGEGSAKAIDDIVSFCKPQATIILMGVSESKISINTRLVLEKGLNLLGISRSGKDDFEEALLYMKDEKFQRRLQTIIFEYGKVCNMSEIGNVFEADFCTPFKTVFEWGL